jgi:hypothetical protein
MKFTKPVLSAAIAAFCLMAVAGSVSAAPTTPANPGTGNLYQKMSESSMATGYNGAGLSGGEVEQIVPNIIKNFLSVLGLIAVVLIIYAGFLWMTAGGNEEQVSKAKKLITNAVIGLIIIMAAYSIAYFVISRLSAASKGADCIAPPC